jgi:F-type H+-transporting ATPase subunit beta
MSAAAAVPNQGIIVAVRGSVVDVRFDHHLPPIYSVLHAGEQQQVIVEVLAQRDAHHVRGIAAPSSAYARAASTRNCST